MQKIIAFHGKIMMYALLGTRTNFHTLLYVKAVFIVKKFTCYNIIYTNMRLSLRYFYAVYKAFRRVEFSRKFGFPCVRRKSAKLLTESRFYDGPFRAHTHILYTYKVYKVQK